MEQLNYSVGDKVRRKKDKWDDAWQRSMKRRGIPRLDYVFTVDRFQPYSRTLDVYFVGYDGYWNAEYFELALEKKYVEELE